MRAQSLESHGGNWRAAVRELSSRILWQLRLDRESGRVVTMAGARHELSTMTLDELRSLARREAIDRTEEAIARQGAA